MNAHETMQERVWIPGPRGSLAGELGYSTGSDVRAACLLVNPHPLMGGRMDNNVIACLARDLPGAGAAVLRFDYAGIGASGGPAIDLAGSMNRFWETNVAPEDPLLVEEARAARNWLSEHVPAVPLVLVGYSFGAYAAAQVAEGAAGLVLISPTVTRHDLGAVAELDMPVLVVQGRGDFATPDADFERWQSGLGPLTEVVRLPAGNHFFRGMEPLVAEACGRFVERLTTAEDPGC